MCIISKWPSLGHDCGRWRFLEKTGRLGPLNIWNSCKPVEYPILRGGKWMMIRRIALVLWLVGSCAVLGSSCSAQDGVSRMEQVVQSYVSSKQFMGSELVAREKTNVLDKGNG